MLQLSFKKRGSTEAARHGARTLSELRHGETGILDSIELAEEEARRMMELGFLPGARVAAAHCAPGGDPRVYRVDGSEVAMRRETASRMKLRQLDPARDLL
jgi:Fe2+ transport system protein FeoA